MEKDKKKKNFLEVLRKKEKMLVTSIFSLLHDNDYFWSLYSWVSISLSIFDLLSATALNFEECKVLLFDKRVSIKVLKVLVWHLSRMPI